MSREIVATAVLTTFRVEGKACIGTIRVLRMSVQGNSRDHAKALLERSFAEYCEGLATIGDLYPILLEQGFRPAPAGGRGSSQYLFITKVIGNAQQTPREEELELANALRNPR